MRHTEGRGQRAEGRKVISTGHWSLVTIFLLFTLFTGCVASKTELKEVDKKLTIENISVVQNGKVLLIEASGPVTYTAFKLIDPVKLVLDIPGADIEKVRAPIEVNNEFITQITTAGYGEHTTTPIGRIEIGLKEGVETDITYREGNITIGLSQTVATSAKAGELSSETVIGQETLQDTPQDIIPAPTSEPVAIAVEKEQTISTETAAIKKMDIKKADKLIKIGTRRENDRTIIRIVGNSTIGDFNAFDIAQPLPPRIVVDVWNVGSVIPKSDIEMIGIGVPNIKKVRIGEYPNKIRLVFDSNQKTLPPYIIERVEDSLVITLGKDAAVDKSDTVLSQVMPKSVDTSVKIEQAAETDTKKDDYAEIKAIDFKQLKDKASVFIMATRKVQYQLSKTQDETSIILDIKNAVIPEDLRKTLDASDLNMPVITISSFQTGTDPLKDVRILIKTREKAVYDISQADENIQIDFPLVSAPQVIPQKAEVKNQGGRDQGAEEAKEIKEIHPTKDTSKIDTTMGEYTGRKISLDFKDADITNILRLMAEISNLNIIAGADIQGKVSLRLVDVPWDQAFNIILKTNGLGKVQEGNVVRIMPILKIKQEQEELIASKKAKEKLEDLEIKLVPINYAVAGTLESQVRGLLSDRGNISVEARTNTLIIKDIPVNIKDAIDLIKKLDTPTPQVLIEARIIEAQSNFARDLGVQWGLATGTTSKDKFNTAFGSTSVAPPATSTPTGFIGSGGVFSAQPNYAVSLPAAGSAGTLGAMGFSFGKLTGDPFLLDLRISAGEKKGLTKTISRPRITTLDNKEAKISQGDSVPFETTSSSGTQTQFIDATLELTVTPHITPDGSVSMKIKASRNSIGSFRSAAGTPSISKKEASTEIIVKDGETAVIGGIVVADKSDAVSGIPFLKDIPLLGWLFKNKSVSDAQTELLIFITPNIVKGKIEIS